MQRTRRPRLVCLSTLLICTSLFVGCSQDNGTAKTSEVVEEHIGKATYDRYCRVCHHPGSADSPKFGDLEDWASRLVKGRETLITSTLEGIPPGMPKRGACLSCSDEDLTNSVDYMIDALASSN